MRVARHSLLSLSAALLLLPSNVWAWGSAHGWIRRWAVSRLPEAQKVYFGAEHLDALRQKYTSLQDQHAGGKRPDLDRYCQVPNARLSLHDVNKGRPTDTVHGMQWYFTRIAEEMRGGHPEEAVKYLGVLCHWCEDPGSLSAHSSPVSEQVLRQLVPPPPQWQNRNYLFGVGWVELEGRDLVHKGAVFPPEQPYSPRLIGATIAEAACRLHQQQRLLQYHNSGLIVPALQARLRGDETALSEIVAEATLRNARLIADLIYTAGCLASGEIPAEQATKLAAQPLTDWLPDNRDGMIPHPYYVTPFLVNQAMDLQRKLHPLQLVGAESVEHGFGMGTPYTLRFTFAGGVYDRFQVRVGLHPTAGTRGKVVFAITANGKQVMTSPAIAAGQPAQLLTVLLPSTPLVELGLCTVAAEGSEPTHNLTVWGGPTLRR